MPPPSRGLAALCLLLPASALFACANENCPNGTVWDSLADMCVLAPVDSGPMFDNGTDQTHDAEIDQEFADLGACNATCGGSTPMCDHATGQCVACLGSNDCNGATPHCSNGACEECINSAHCQGPTPVCDGGTCVGCASRAECTGEASHPACNPVSGACVACDATNEASDCADTPITPRCSATQECVECRGDTASLDCPSATASRCSRGACVGCTSNAHCNHVPGRPHCSSGTCVECSPATEATDCGSESCNPATRACSGIERNSRGVCQQCVSDSDCTQVGGTFRCIPMNYQGAPRGGYCMRAMPGCMRPYGVVITAASLSGAASTTYCGIDQSEVSCEAVNALRASIQCPGGSASECMAEGAMCETVGLGNNRCTYSCSAPDECPASGSSATCGAGYCGS